MISSEHRFHGHNSLNYVYRKGSTVRGPLVSIKFVPSRKGSPYRLAIVVSKKVAKQAVTRNRIRRRLYEAFRLYEHDMHTANDMVVTVFSDAVASISSEELARMVGAQLRQAEIIVSPKYSGTAPKTL